MYQIDDYDYVLPVEQIAQSPATERDGSKLLVVDRRSGELHDRNFSDVVDLIQEGDLLVVNDTKVFPARLEGRKETGGKVELFILGYPPVIENVSGEAFNSRAEITGLVKSSKRPKSGSRLIFPENLAGEILEYLDGGKVKVALYFNGPLEENLIRSGRIPLPTYIKRYSGDEQFDRERYQTVYAEKTGAVAAPTAGLHFTDALITRLGEKGVRISSITLHVGYGTFSPVRVDDIRSHGIHHEYLSMSRETAELINDTVALGGRIWAVGTTSVRAIESAATGKGRVCEFEGESSLYIYPGYDFKVVNNLITNFHLPKSSLLFLVSALAGRENIMGAYEHAVENGYRFYSYGDAMAIVDGQPDSY